MKPLLIAAALMAAQPALSCAITMPTCTSASNGRVSEAYINPPGAKDVSLFFEYDAAGEVHESLMLIDCTTRKGVSVRLPRAGERALSIYDVTDYLTEVVISEKGYTLSQIRAGLRERGAESRMTTLPGGHCGCELPKMETIGC